VVFIRIVFKLLSVRFFLENESNIRIKDQTTLRIRAFFW